MRSSLLPDYNYIDRQQDCGRQRLGGGFESRVADDEEVTVMEGECLCGASVSYTLEYIL